MVKQSSTDVVDIAEQLPEKRLAELADMNFQQMLDAGVIDISEIDDTAIVDQADLVGKTFILYDWDIKLSPSFGGYYAVCRVKTAEGTAVFTDGGAGIVTALEHYEHKMADSQVMPILFWYGLRASHYTKEVDGAQIPATTYYFDNRTRP